MNHISKNIQMPKQIKLLFSLSILSIFLIGCQSQEVVDLSSLSAEEPPTRTPVPTEKAEPVLAARAQEPTRAPASGQTYDLIAQLDKIYERLTGIPQFDLNSETFSRFDGAIQAAIVRINEIAASGGSDQDTQVAYEQAIADLVELANVGQGDVVSVQLAKASDSFKSPQTEELADAFEEADAEGISAAIDDLAETVTDLSPEEKAAVAEELMSVATVMAPAASAVESLIPDGAFEEGSELPPDFSSQVMAAAQAILAGDEDEILEKLKELKKIVDAIGANLELAQFLSLTIENVERETVAEKDLESLFSGKGNVRINQVEITMLKTKEDEALSVNMIPELSEPTTEGQMCVLTTAKDVQCLNALGEWEKPAALDPFSGRITAMTDCNARILLATDRELIYLDGEESTAFAAEGYPFIPPTQLVCDSENLIWALPSAELADSPWLFKDEEWTNYSTILQNTIGIHTLDTPWGTKFEVNEKSVVRRGKRIDHIPFVTRQTAESWDIFYNIYWETGLWGAVTDQEGEMWFPGSALYHLNFNQQWYGFEGDIGPAYTLLPNGLILGSNPETGGVHIFDKASTWWQLSDWPADFEATVLTIDSRGRVWAIGENGVLVWSGESWDLLAPLAEPPMHMIVIADGPNL